MCLHIYYNICCHEHQLYRWSFSGYSSWFKSTNNQELSTSRCIFHQGLSAQASEAITSASEQRHGVCASAPWRLSVEMKIYGTNHVGENNYPKCYKSASIPKSIILVHGSFTLRDSEQDSTFLEAVAALVPRWSMATQASSPWWAFIVTGEAELPGCVVSRS